MSSQVSLHVNGRTLEVEDNGCSLLEALRDRLGLRSVKDGCSPQGQCGCCTVLVDGQARVACVTPLARVAGRTITTVEGLPDRDDWAERLCATGGSQCGFCTPGIVMRLALQPANPRQALLAHLCRCTGWQTILDAADPSVAAVSVRSRDLAAASRRASIEGRSPQVVSPAVALGLGGFADDNAPADALVAVMNLAGEWVVGETLTDARRLAAKVQGRRTTAPLAWPIELPEGVWDRTLQTTWVEPAYLEPDAAWCEPGGEPSAVLANGGAFGGKVRSRAGTIARELADRHGRAVRVLYSREDTVRLGPKRPPIAIGIRQDGTGEAAVARTPGIAEAIASVAPGMVVREVDIAGPPTSAALRAAGWAEVAALISSLSAGPIDRVVSPDHAMASASFDAADGSIHLSVRCGDVLDETVLRSFCIGAAHQALGWVRSEGLTVDPVTGEIHDLTIRSFGVLRAIDMPHVEVEIEPDDGEPVNGSDAVFAAVAAAAWRAAGHPQRWPHSH